MKNIFKKLLWSAVIAIFIVSLAATIKTTSAIEVQPCTEQTDQYLLVICKH